MDPITENYQLKWHSFSSHLHTCVANHYNSESFSDVVLLTIDGHPILAHRLVLSTCSQYFHQILKLQKVATTLPLMIVLPSEINHKTMKILMHYMYTGEATVSKDILENVLRGGDLLKVQGLWRPREEGLNDRKLVKVHQKVDESRSKSSTPKIQDVRSDSRQEEVIKRIEKANERPDAPQQNSEMAQIGKENVVTETPVITKKSLEGKHTTSAESTSNIEKNSGSAEKLQLLVIKEEPIEWSEVNDCEMELVEEEEVFQSEMTIKPEVVLNDHAEESQSEEQIYSPLMCELCAETFNLPADWVKHIQSHTDMMPAKRQRRGRPSNDDESGTFPPLHCDMCQKYFPTPAEWVHHIQNTHTEFELRLSNKSSPVRPIKLAKQVGASPKICTLCNKKFPSHASMLIHKRTHTGERPYMCEYCYKGFNVKSNLLRHLRTLHDKIINSTEIESKEEPCSSDQVKTETDSS